MNGTKMSYRAEMSVVLRDFNKKKKIKDRDLFVSGQQSYNEHNVPFTVSYGSFATNSGEKAPQINARKLINALESIEQKKCGEQHASQKSRKRQENCGGIVRCCFHNGLALLVFKLP